MDKQWLFDRKWTRNFTKARESAVDALLNDLRPEADLRSALDVGCGVGDFSGFLARRGFRVVGVDGRQQNISEAGRRHPEVEFVVSDAEELSSAQVGSFDLVLCFGLLYHLENPFRAIRQLHAATAKVLLLEGMCLPDDKPTMSLFDEVVAEDQSLNSVAFYPSEACLVKMLYRAGFPFVYGLRRLPEDRLYVKSVWRKRVRTILVGSKQRLGTPSLILAAEKRFMIPDTATVWAGSEWNPWRTWLMRVYRLCESAISRVRLIGSRAFGFRSQGGKTH